jgi:hypothetical protein
MTKFHALDDPGFVAVAGEIRRWVRALVVSADHATPPRESSRNPSTYRSSPETGGAPGSRILRITQGGSQYTGATTVNGGSVFQGNYVGQRDLSL